MERGYYENKKSFIFCRENGLIILSSSQIEIEQLQLLPPSQLWNNIATHHKEL